MGGTVAAECVGHGVTVTDDEILLIDGFDCCEDDKEGVDDLRGR